MVANICLNSGFIKSWQHWEIKFQVYFRMEFIYEIVLHFQFILKLLAHKYTSIASVLLIFKRCFIIVISVVKAGYQC